MQDVVEMMNIYEIFRDIDISRERRFFIPYCYSVIDEVYTGLIFYENEQYVSFGRIPNGCIVREVYSGVVYNDELVEEIGLAAANSLLTIKDIIDTMFKVIGD